MSQLEICVDVSADVSADVNPHAQGRRIGQNKGAYKLGSYTNMPEIVNLSDTKKTAFTRGFWKGMAAPLMLFSSLDVSAQQQVQFQALPRRQASPYSDWVKVGNALRDAIKKDCESRGKQ